MHEYLQINFARSGAEHTDILIASLSETGFTGFDESGRELAAFIPLDQFNEGAFIQAVPPGLAYTKIIIADRNWNEEWEKSFDPVVISGFCAIRASFHSPVQTCLHEIIVTPKMSFGTGHHATTYQMIELMQTLDFAGRTVIDFGTGTGALAILAEKCGAGNIHAIDNDYRSIENALENSSVNHCSRITISNADVLPPGITADIILANINKNVIIAELGNMIHHLNPGGKILVSGLLTGDRTAILEEAATFNLVLQREMARDNWIALLFSMS